MTLITFGLGSLYQVLNSIQSNLPWSITMINNKDQRHKRREDLESGLDDPLTFSSLCFVRIVLEKSSTRTSKTSKSSLCRTEIDVPSLDRE